MMDFGLIDGFLVVALSFGLALVLIWVAQKIGIAVTQRNQDVQHSHSGSAVLLFESGILVDANDAGKTMLLAEGQNKSDWSFLAALLEPQFPDFPSTQGSQKDHSLHTFPSIEGEKEFVLLEQWDNMAHITVQSSSAEQKPPPSLHPSRASGSIISEAPYPIWQSTENGEISWANAAYLKLAKDLEIEHASAPYPKIFNQSTLIAGGDPVRTSVSDAPKAQNYWYDVATTKTQGAINHFATSANAIVNAEIAQRNFVQTLTKTFAQLSIGLAIFDRNRQLALFNPALIDLTALPAEFLSSRPTLLTVFDRMRENRMMPEPRNYSSWREQIAELVVAASDDRYTETWTLPSGVTYRVVGRPHPDGAIAFLFEDISAEVSLARRFRTEMELGKSTLDSLSEAVVVFAATGKLNFCNLAYRLLWDSEPENSVVEYGFQDGIREWRLQTEKSDVWEKLRHHILDINPRESWSAQLVHKSGQPLVMRVVSLSGGFTSIVFETVGAETIRDTSSEILAG